MMILMGKMTMMTGETSHGTVVMMTTTTRATHYLVLPVRRSQAAVAQLRALAVEGLAVAQEQEQEQEQGRGRHRRPVTWPMDKRTASQTLSTPSSALVASCGVRVLSGSSRARRLTSVLASMLRLSVAWRGYSAPHTTCGCVRLCLHVRVDGHRHLRAFLGSAADAKRVGQSGAHAYVHAAPVTVDVMLAKKWSKQDPTGWWMSEKLDGVRGYWTGSALVSRAGNSFTPPAWYWFAWVHTPRHLASEPSLLTRGAVLHAYCRAICRFTAALPKDTPLDGELWVGRGQFHATLSIVRVCGCLRVHQRSASRGC